MADDRVSVTPASLARARRALCLIAAAGLATSVTAVTAFAQQNIPRLSNNLPLTIGPGPTAPRPTGIPTPTNVPTNNRAPTTTTTFTTPTVTPRPTVTPTPTVTTTTPTATTVTPTATPTTTTLSTPTATPSGGTPSGTPSVNNARAPAQNVDPKVRNFSSEADQSQYAMGANPNCSSYRSFEGFGGRPCGTKSGALKKRNVVQSTGDSAAQTPKAAKAVTKASTKTAAKKGAPRGGAAAASESCRAKSSSRWTARSPRRRRLRWRNAFV